MISIFDSLFIYIFKFLICFQTFGPSSSVGLFIFTKLHASILVKPDLFKRCESHFDSDLCPRFFDEFYFWTVLDSTKKSQFKFISLTLICLPITSGSYKRFVPRNIRWKKAKNVKNVKDKIARINDP